MSLEIDLPDTPWHTVPMRVAPEVTRGGTPPRNGEEVAGHISLGEPLVYQLSARRADEDPDLRAYLETQGQWRFCVIRLACGFPPDGDGQLVQARVQVDLSSGEGSGEDRPVVWSMAPTALVDQATTTRTVTLSAKTAIAEAGSVGVTRSHASEDNFLQGYGEMQRSAFWLFRQTRVREIAGTYRLCLVVRLPVHARGRASLRVDGRLRRKRFAVVPVSAAIPVQFAEFEV
jgi:hypothetical protein